MDCLEGIYLYNVLNQEMNEVSLMFPVLLEMF